MSVIVQQPDSLSFAGNLKKFVVTSAVAVALQLNKGAEQILNEIYQPGAGNIVEIDLRTVINKVLSVTLPGTNLITEQSSGFADFTATIDGTAVAFRVIKGGVLELGSMAIAFVNEHFLTWQIQDKTILQHQPEWLTVYTNAARNLKAKAYYQDNTDASMLLTALDAGKLLAVDVSWPSINSLFVKKNPIAWEVWFEDLAGTRLSYVQRYCLRNSDDEEKIFIWANTMGGIDSISLTGSAEDDKKLEHLIAEMGDESLQEYQTDKKREIKQSTGFLTVDESRWIEDFFYSGRRYLVGEDGAVRSIVLASSKIVGSTADDLFDYEFNYRLASESQLLNLERSFDSLPALEVPVDFFLTELLSGLPVAQYSDGLLMAVQSPFAQAWQKLSMAQLWGSALPGLVDGTTISVVNGKLQVNGVSGGVGVSKWGDLTEKPFNSLSNLFSVSPEGLLTLANAYAPVLHTHPYRPDTWTPTWAEISEKPEWVNRMSWDGVATVISSDVHITGKLVVDGTIQFFGSGAGGDTGGGGASALWELTDVADDMVNSIYGDLPMYNGTHFARYNISNFATVGHSHPYLSDSDARIANWSTAFGWGNHAGLYRPIGYVPSWGEITSKPTWTEKFGWDGAAMTVSTDMHITGKLVVDGTIQFFGAGVGGTGGGGSTTLWGLSDVDDDVQNSVYGDLIMYNGTHFARINQSALAPAIHTHTIGQVTGLQGALDTKMAVHTHPYLSDADARIVNWNTAYTHSQSSHAYLLLTGGELTGPLTGTSATFNGVGIFNSNGASNAHTITLSRQNPINFPAVYQGVVFKSNGVDQWLFGQREYNANNNDDLYIFSWEGSNAMRINRTTCDVQIYQNLTALAISTTGGNSIQWNTAYTHSQTTHNKAFVGLNLVDNTADINKSVAYAANANSANYAGEAGLLNGRSDYWHTGNFTPANYALLSQINGVSVNYIPKWNGGSFVNSSIFDNGYVGIGISNPGSPLDVFRSDSSAVNNPGNSQLRVTALGGINAKFMSIGYDPILNLGYIQPAESGIAWRNLSLVPNAGNVGIGYSSGTEISNNKLAVNGAGYFGGNITSSGNIIGLGTMQFYTASDRRLKTDFETITNPIEKIKSLTGYFFNYTDQAMSLGGYTNRRDIGLIAQDVHAILPEATGKLWNTDFMGYKADKLIPLLVEAIKQQQNEIDQLKRQIAA